MRKLFFARLIEARPGFSYYDIWQRFLSGPAVDNYLITTTHQLDAMNTGQEAVTWCSPVGTCYAGADVQIALIVEVIARQTQPFIGS
ncbi:MAG TPA: hypothetical protein VND96_07920 [Candidatus Micrarchaeaceae archaeon]|nr:hypothetical protein [Candidatus Micrarchaeaceae archaeon]